MDQIVIGDTLPVFVPRPVAAFALGLSLPSVDRLLGEKRLQVARAGRRVLILKSDLGRLVGSK
jgi:hypothetical protein